MAAVREVFYASLDSLPPENNINPYVTNGLSHLHQMGESTFIFRGTRSNSLFSFHFSMKVMKANRIASNGTPHFVLSYLVPFCLPMFHKKDSRFILAAM